MQSFSIYHATLWAVMTALHAVPPLMMRFQEDRVYRHETVQGSMTVPLDAGGFGFGYLNAARNFVEFDAACRSEIKRVAGGDASPPNEGERDDLAYLSCLPWFDYTALDNALPHAADCIPRISWGKIVHGHAGFTMAMTLQVHHALVNGEAAGAFFSAVQRGLDGLRASGPQDLS